MAIKLKKKNVPILIVVSVLILLALFGSGLRLFSFSTLSISDVQVKDQGTKIIIYAHPTGGDELNFQFTPSELAPYLEKLGYKTTKTSTLKVKFISGEKKFNFYTSDANTIKLINSQYSGYYFGFSGSISKCINEGYSNTVKVIPNNIPTRYDCYEYYNNGNINSFAGGSGTGFKINFDIDGEGKDLTDSSQSITMASGKAKISWQGNLLSINEVNAPQSQVFHVSSSWYLVDNQAYTNTENAFQTFKSCGGEVVSKDKFSSCLSSYNQAINQNIKSINQNYIDANANVKSVDFENGAMRIIFENPSLSVIPTFTIELDASKVGLELVKLKGKPDIVSCISDQVFDTSKSIAASAQIKNIGDSEGTFDFSITCNNDQMSGSGSAVDFDAGQTKSVAFQLAGGNSGTDTNEATCKLTVTDRNGGGSDSCSFGFDVEYDPDIGQCVGTETKCSPDGKTLFTCSNGNFLPEVCGTGKICTVSGVDAICIDDPNSDDNGGGSGECEWWNIACKIKSILSQITSGIFDALLIVKWTLVAIGGFVSFFVSRDLASGLKSLRNNKIALNIIGLITSIGVILFLFSFIGSLIFWIILVAIVASFILINFTGLSYLRRR